MEYDSRKLENLPIELFEKVLEHLNKQEIINLSRSSYYLLRKIRKCFEIENSPYNNGTESEILIYYLIDNFKNRAEDVYQNLFNEYRELFIEHHFLLRHIINHTYERNNNIMIYLINLIDDTIYGTLYERIASNYNLNVKLYNVLFGNVNNLVAFFVARHHDDHIYNSLLTIFSRNDQKHDDVLSLMENINELIGDNLIKGLFIGNLFYSKKSYKRYESNKIRNNHSIQINLINNNQLFDRKNQIIPVVINYSHYQDEPIDSIFISFLHEFNSKCLQSLESLEPLEHLEDKQSRNIQNIDIEYNNLHNYKLNLFHNNEHKNNHLYTVRDIIEHINLWKYKYITYDL